MANEITSHPSAVQRCLDAWESCRQLWLDRINAKGEKPEEAEFMDTGDAVEKAHQAFRDAMPDLDGIASLPEFIACVTRGQLKGAISAREASQLMSSARLVIKLHTLLGEPAQPARAQRNKPAAAGLAHYAPTPAEPCSHASPPRNYFLPGAQPHPATAEAEPTPAGAEPAAASPPKAA